MAAPKRKKAPARPADFCQGTTKAGTPCQRQNALLHGYCPAHREQNPRPGGRILTLTPEVHEKIVGLVKAGNYMEVAAAAAGVPRSTFYDWLRLGAKDMADGNVDTPLAELSDALQRAEAEAEARDVARIAQAGGKNWQALAWRLERKNPKRWGRKDHLTLGGDDEAGPIKVTTQVALGEDTQALAEELLRKAGGERLDTGGR